MSDFEQKLESLWNQGGRDVALHFLRRAVKTNMTLVELLSTLKFEGVADHLGEISLNDILNPPSRSPSAPAGQLAGAHRVQAEAPRRAGRRKRRSGDELRVIHQAIVEMVRDEPGSLNTIQIVKALEEQDHDFDTMRVNAFLRTLQAEGYATDLGGKPKSWRATPLLRNRDNDPAATQSGGGSDFSDA